jgi:hypothetical protein
MAGLRLNVTIKISLAFTLTAAAAFAQIGEVGALIGYGFYHNGTITTPNGTATAGISNGVAAGAILCEDLYEHLSGEVVYLYQNGHPFVSVNGARANASGGSHSIHYDLLVHIRSKESRWRPFFAGGLGAKYYGSSGPDLVVQPLSNVVVLTNRTQWEFLATIGGGLKYRMKHHVLLRAEFLDYLTPFPDRVFIPARGGTSRGIFQQFTPMVGVSYWW